MKTNYISLSPLKKRKSERFCAFFQSFLKIVEPLEPFKCQHYWKLNIETFYYHVWYCWKIKIIIVILKSHDRNERSSLANTCCQRNFKGDTMLLITGRRDISTGISDISTELSWYKYVVKGVAMIEPTLQSYS